ncbi:SDR family oxidoreductase [Sphingomonas sp. A2-49]|uniref:SDR family NAD(P)-dependent oxidoreductase n=1 Tax=Sphingomonas sp. A2-49 TaxID=1391375 RepID=UPI0021CFD03B|nr:SDR family oxidoreductase [Sphingomonas sp. A2-49]MCU6453144.1 SDR family oxidoreductase [Sphingomonas sp. A2-49]
MELTGKRIIITGGASGIAASAVRGLVAGGARVASIDVATDAGAQVVATANAAGGAGLATFHTASVVDRPGFFAAVDAAVQVMGGLDGLIHAAGVQQYKPAEDLDDDDWDRVMGINARGTMIANQAVFPHLKANGGGRIVNFASAAGLVGLPGAPHYSASKGAVLGWTRALAQAWAQHGITVNAVAPAMWTAMYDATRGRLSPDELVAHDAMMARAIPLGGRLGDPDIDMTPVLAFLVGDGARFITGQTLPVDGGTAMTR